jgi:hypothetical protein
VSDQVTIKIGQRHVFSSIEDIQKRARDILRGSKPKFIQIRDPEDEDFMLELFKTHPNAEEKGILKQGATVKVFKGRSKQNTPCFFISITTDQDTVRSTPSQAEENSLIEDISYMKCINEVAVRLSHNMVDSTRNLGIDVKNFLDLAVELADQFPFNKPKILKLILKMIPHSALHVQFHAIFLRILFYILTKMPYYEERILEAVITRFIQIDVSIKSKQLALKRHFTSYDLKADVYLYHLINHFKNRIYEIEGESLPSLIKKDLTNSEDFEMKDQDNEETFENTEASRNKIEDF